MFTGIVEELGTVQSVVTDQQADAARITVRGPLVVTDAVHGASIAVNGCCLTVTERDGDTFSADVGFQTLALTSLGALVPGDRVNLERALRADARLGGHIMSGHVDGLATVIAIERSEEFATVCLRLPAEFTRYVVDKGSIALDGASLTVAGIEGDEVWVMLIPTTLALTTFGGRRPGDAVNVEVDVMAKYAEKMLTAWRQPA
jgi:riboflavin synthase